jgi:hypothetical protein
MTGKRAGETGDFLFAHRIVGVANLQEEKRVHSLGVPRLENVVILNAIRNASWNSCSCKRHLKKKSVTSPTHSKGQRAAPMPVAA